MATHPAPLWPRLDGRLDRVIVVPPTFPDQKGVGPVNDTSPADCRECWRSATATAAPRAAK